MSSPTHELVNDCLAVRARLIARCLTSLYDSELSPHGVTIAQVNLLAALAAVGSCSQAQLGTMLQLDRSTVSRNVKLLTAGGLVEVRDADGRGVRDIAPTSVGMAKLQTIMPAWRSAQRQAAELLRSDGVATVRNVASSINEFIPTA